MGHRLTCSADFPATTAVRSTFGNTCNAFVLRTLPDVFDLVFSTGLGGGFDTAPAELYFYRKEPEQFDRGGSILPSAAGIVVDASYNAYVVGTSFGFVPTTPRAFQPTKLSPGFVSKTAHVSKVGPLGGVIYSTCLGGPDGETYGAAIAIDRAGNAYVGGYTTSTHFPGAPALTPNPTAGFVSKLSPTGGTLSYTTLLGAGANGVAVLQPALRVGIFYPTQIYVTGIRYNGTPYYLAMHMFVVRLDENSITTPEGLLHDHASDRFRHAASGAPSVQKC